MSSPQYMPFYIGDYLRDTMHLTREEHGAYLLLIFACWIQKGKLINDDAVLATIAKSNENEWKNLKFSLAKFFKITPRYWRHKRVDYELKKLFQLHEVRSKAGSKGAAKKKHARAFQSQSHIQLASNEANKEPGLRPAPAKPCAAPPDGILEKGLALLGHRRGGLIRRMRVRFGDEVVGGALAATERRQPAEPAAYFVSCCEHGNGAAEPTGPPDHDPGPQTPPPSPEGIVWFAEETG